MSDSKILIFGSEPLIISETVDFLRSFYGRHGFKNRVSVFVEDPEDIDLAVRRSCQVDMFGGGQLIEMIFPKVSVQVTGALKILEHFNYDNARLILRFSELDRRTVATKWFESLSKDARVLNVSLSRAQFPSFLKSRLEMENIKLEDGAFEFLLRNFENNASVAIQEISKLKYLINDPGKVVSYEEIKSIIFDFSRFEINDLSEAMVSGDLSRSLKILDSLIDDGVPISLILWQISEDLRLLAHLSEGYALDKLRVWGVRKNIFSRVEVKIDPHKLAECLVICAKLDRITKGVQEGSDRLEIERILIIMADLTL